MGHCMHCNSFTMRYDIDYKGFICSDKCLAQVDAGYAQWLMEDDNDQIN